ncbi:MAG: hypothetical protein GVY13_16575 [Alphaproteobacteria bacterium]|jgi:hypothetical protein|nr:hypothetical protein [Alphaproteobacteria bacterium]
MRDETPALPDGMITPGLAARLRERVVARLSEALAGFGPPFDGAMTARIPDLVAGFDALYARRPVRETKGGSGYNDSLTLSVLAGLLQPALIVESGVFRGHTTWLFRQACPHAALFCFDPAPEYRIWSAEGARYFGEDWSAVPVPLPEGGAGQALAFFDDHVSQARRVREAWERGFRLLLFDDNFPAEHLYATGVPPVPTLAMLQDGSLTDGTEIVWRRNGRERRYTYSEADTDGAAALLDRVLVLPDLAPLTRHPPQSNLTLVRLVA